MDLSTVIKKIAVIYQLSQLWMIQMGKELQALAAFKHAQGQ